MAKERRGERPLTEPNLHLVETADESPYELKVYALDKHEYVRDISRRDGYFNGPGIVTIETTAMSSVTVEYWTSDQSFWNHIAKLITMGGLTTGPQQPTG